MKIAIIAATGKVGHLVQEEAKYRGYNVTAIVRDARKLTDNTIHFIEKNLFSLTTDDIKPFDVVVNAFGTAPDNADDHIRFGRHLITLFSGLKTRLIVVGGAGSLFVDPAKTQRLMDTAEFPDAFKSIAAAQGQNLQDLQKTTDVNWTFLSPAAFFDPNGKRTNHYIVGNDNVIVNQNGDSYISYSDYAVALIDEVEKPAHIRQRFTVVGEKG